MTSLVVERDGAVEWLTLARPETKNALDRPLVLALGAAIAAASADAEVRVIVLSGRGGAFCSGADLKAVMSDGEDLASSIDARIAEYHVIIRAIAHAPKPVLAVLDGPAVGFGCDLALACDLRIASSRAYLQEKFVKIGLMPDGGGTYWLPRLVGTARAMELILTGAPIDAARAEALGIVNRVVPPEQLDADARAFAHQLAAGPPLAFAAIKRAVVDGLGAGLEAALAREAEGQARCLRSEDAFEGVSAFLSKRQPSFQGR